MPGQRWHASMRLSMRRWQTHAACHVLTASQHVDYAQLACLDTAKPHPFLIATQHEANVGPEGQHQVGCDGCASYSM